MTCRRSCCASPVRERHADRDRPLARRILSASCCGARCRTSLLRRASDIAIHIVTRESDAGRAPQASAGSRYARSRCISSGATLAVAAAVAIGELLTTLTPFPNLSMVFLLAVLFTAVRVRHLAAIYASVLSFFAYNFFFIEPIYTLHGRRSRTNCSRWWSSWSSRSSTSALAGRVREQAQIAVEPHARDAPALRIHAAAFRPRDARRRGRRRGERNQCAASAGPRSCCSTQGDDLVLTAAWPPEDDSRCCRR